MLQWGHYRAHQVWQECSPSGQVPPSGSYHCCDVQSPDCSPGPSVRGIFPVLYKDAELNAWAEDVDLRVNLAMDVGKARDFFRREMWSLC